MKLLRQFYLYILYHQHYFNKILKLTNINLSFKNKIKKSEIYNIRYQAYSSFYTNNYRNAEIYFELLKESTYINTNDCNYLAYIYARRNEKEKAIFNWCLALEKNKYNKLAKYALQYIRTKNNEVNFTNDDDFFNLIYPKIPFYIPVKLIFRIFIIFLLSTFILSGGWLLFNNIYRYYLNQKKTSRSEINQIYLPDYNPILLDKPKEKDNQYSFNEKELKNLFEQIKLEIIQDKVVIAQININKILLSNASSTVKLRMGLLENFIKKPDYALFKNEISFESFFKDKQLYQNVYILWSGVIKNVSIQKEQIIFDLIIGDESRGIISGIIPVIFKKAIIIKNNDSAIIFGRIKVNSNEYYIEGDYIIKNKL